MSEANYNEFPDANDYPQYSQQYLRAHENAQRQAEAKSDPEKKHRIKMWMAMCLVGVAIFVDLLQFLLTGAVVGVVIAPIISVGATFGFWVWFKLLRVSYVASPKKLATTVVQSLLELFPAIDALPILTLGIIIIIVITRMEDRGGVLGKVAGMANAEFKNQIKVGAINKSIRDQVDNSDIGKLRPKSDGKARTPQISPNATSSSKTDNNNQNGIRPKNQPESKQQNKNTSSDREMSSLEKDIEKNQSQLQQYQSDLTTKERRYKEDEDSFWRNLEMIKSSRETTKEEQAGWYREHLQRTSSLSDEINGMKRKISGLKNLISQSSNKISELERARAIKT